ncbi:DIM/SIM/IMP family subclass B1 metallo-beta-lactamase [Aliiglaciecola sp. CAU 1673]|uniref:DIM/SIM/IMP family subclass B1 metallo-beta-lactamase n=1 Tax=Aliiglaciecola sp. CAU 1673 TaxID=3032595 RepID=UPI0023DA6D0C|nr:DIM/SIM/IMP family subclass B1 metallo-beta-lactamase [Aliiglaciecola sp. CAU 1673]MDF2178801.1 DIM/SIM/IMP family subclass B1 metallo-beta-lactamase [Aliiglaciecola sp. CAU 1673]
MRWLFNLLLLVATSSLYAQEAIPALQVKQIAEGVYQHISYQEVKGFGLVDANGLIIVDDNNAYLIDTPWSESVTEEIVDWIQAQGFELVASLSTHSHEDRSAGIAWLNARAIPTYASALTNAQLKAKGKALATQTFSTEEMTLADGRIQVFYPGAGHSLDNIVVWVPESKILFGGCLVKSLEAKNLGYTGEAVIESWPGSLARVMDKYPQIQLVVPGHGASGDQALLLHTKALAQSAARP